jgi:hypothetical protein
VRTADVELFGSMAEEGRLVLFILLDCSNVEQLIPIVECLVEPLAETCHRPSELLLRQLIILRLHLIGWRQSSRFKIFEIVVVFMARRKAFIKLFDSVTFLAGFVLLNYSEAVEVIDEILLVRLNLIARGA